MAELIIERLTGEPIEQYVSAAMEWGTLHEPRARDLYALLMDVEVIEVGFVPHPRITMSGCSPDGLVGDDGLIQIKCPNTSTHIETLLGATVDLCYRKQMQWEMNCTERQWCDFVSFDPRLPPEFQIFIKRFLRDQKMIDELELYVKQFLKELDKKIDDLKERYGHFPQFLEIPEAA